MRKLFSQALLIACTICAGRAQWNPTPSCWTYGTGGNAEIHRIVEISGKQALLIAGRTQTSIIGNQDVVVMQIDNTGTPVWAVNVGTEDNEQKVSGLVNLGDSVYCMAIEADTPNNRQPLIICIDSSGNQVASMLLYNPFNQDEIKPKDLLALPGTSKLLLIAEAKYQPTGKKGILVVKVDPLLATIDIARIMYIPGGSANDLQVSRGIVVKDSIVVLTGKAKDALLGEDAAFLLVSSPSGNIQKVYVYRSDGKAEGIDVEFVKASGSMPPGYVLTVRSKHASSDEDILLIRVDTSNIGNVRWHVNYTSMFNKKEIPTASSYLPGLDQLVVVARQKDNTSQAHRILVLAVDAQTGDTLWTRGIDGNAEDVPKDVIFTSGGLIVIGGFTNSYGSGGKSLYLAALSQNGTLLSSGCCILDTPGGVLFTELYTGNLAVAVDTFPLIAIPAGRVIPNYVDTARTCGSPVLPDWNVPTGCWTLGTDSADLSTAVSKTLNGDLLVAGATRGTSDSDWEMLIMRINSAGTILWSTTVGRPGDDIAMSIAECPSGEIVVAGVTDSLSSDIFVVLLDASGNLLWSRLIAGSGVDTCVAVLCTSSGIYVGGHTNSFGPDFDLFFIKLDMNANILTSITVGSSVSEFMTALRETDYGFLAGGYQYTGQSDFLLLSINALLNSVNWAVTWGNMFVNERIIYLEQTLTGEILIGGIVQPGPFGAADFYVALFDPTFTSLSAEVVGGGAQDDLLAVVTQRWWDADFALAGTTFSFGNSSPEFFFVGLSNNLLDTLFSAAYGTSSLDSIRWAVLTNDGGFVAGGFTKATSAPTDPSDIAITKINAYGQIVTQMNCCQPRNEGFSVLNVSSTVQTVNPILNNVVFNLSSMARKNSAGFWICGTPLLLSPQIYAIAVSDSVVKVQVTIPAPENIYNAMLYRSNLLGDTVLLGELHFNYNSSFTMLDTPNSYRVQYLLKVYPIGGKPFWLGTRVIFLQSNHARVQVALVDKRFLRVMNASRDPMFNVELSIYSIDGSKIAMYRIEALLPYQDVYIQLPQAIPAGVLFIVLSEYSSSSTTTISTLHAAF